MKLTVLFIGLLIQLTYMTSLAGEVLLLSDADLDKQISLYDKAGAWKSSLEWLTPYGSPRFYSFYNKANMAETLIEKHLELGSTIDLLIVNAHGNKEQIFLGDPMSGSEFADVIIKMNKAGVNFSPNFAIYISTCISGCKSSNKGFLDELRTTLVEAKRAGQLKRIEDIKFIGHQALSNQNALLGFKKLDHLYSKLGISVLVSKLHSFGGEQSDDSFLLRSIRPIFSFLGYASLSPMLRGMTSFLITGLLLRSVGGEELAPLVYGLSLTIGTFLLYQTVEAAGRYVRVLTLNSNEVRSGMALEEVKLAIRAASCSSALVK